MRRHGRLRRAERGLERLLLPCPEPMRRDSAKERREVCHGCLPAAAIASALALATSALLALTAPPSSSAAHAACACTSA